MAVEINDGKANKILTLWLRSQKDEQVPPKRPQAQWYHQGQCLTLLWETLKIFLKCIYNGAKFQKEKQEEFRQSQKFKKQ